MRGDVGGDERERGGRENPPRAAEIEARQRDPAAVGELREQDAGDQEARKDEEDVDADVAPGQERYAGVAEGHQQNRNSPQTLDVVPVRHTPALCRLNSKTAAFGRR